MNNLLSFKTLSIFILLCASNLFALPTEEEGLKFLEEKTQEEGVLKTDSGLLYRIVIEGDGPIPSKTDTVAAYYTGTLIDGKEFDSRPIHLTPAMFVIEKLIPAWREALTMMPVGSIWELYVPPHLGYGEDGSGRMIKRNATLVFELELVEIL